MNARPFPVTPPMNHLGKGELQLGCERYREGGGGGGGLQLSTERHRDEGTGTGTGTDKGKGGELHLGTGRHS